MGLDVPRPECNMFAQDYVVSNVLSRFKIRVNLGMFSFISLIYN